MDSQSKASQAKDSQAKDRRIDQRKAIIAQGKAIIAEISGRPVTDISPQQNLVGDLGIDSPRALQLLLEIEDRLGLEISDEDAAKMDTVGDILGYLGAG